MKKFHEVKNIKFDKNKMHISIDGNEYSFLINNISKRLKTATEKQRNTFEISPSGYGIHWPLLDEDLSIDGLLGIKHSPELSTADNISK